MDRRTFVASVAASFAAAPALAELVLRDDEGTSAQHVGEKVRDVQGGAVQAADCGTFIVPSCERSRAELEAIEEHTWLHLVWSPGTNGGSDWCCCIVTP